MKVKLFSDKNLHRAMAGGWSIKALATGKIGTLGGRMLEVECPEDATVKMLKQAVEDKEGIAIADMNICTTSHVVAEDSQLLSALGLNPINAGPLILITAETTTTKPDAASPSGGLKQRERPEPSRTITIDPAEAGSDVPHESRVGGSASGSVRRGAALMEGDNERAGGQMAMLPFQGVGHRLAGGAAGKGGREEQRRRMLAAAERRMGVP